MSNLIEELRRRNVLRVGGLYLVMSWLILQFVDVVFPILEIDEALGRPILALLIGGLPVTLILAWVFEITPDGIKREKDLDRSQMATDGSQRSFDRIIIVVLLLAVGLLLVDKIFLQQADAPEQIAEAVNSYNSVAVLPFVNLSGNEEDEYFSDGLTETLLHILAQSPELKVAARTSVFSFKNKDVDIVTIAESLGVETVLEGSVQRAGNQVRIYAKLIEAKTGFDLWSRTFDRNLDDIFALQDEIAMSVADALEVTLLGNNASPVLAFNTKDMDAYEKYLLALEQKNIASYSSLPLAEGLFKEALAIDPNFVEAKVELAFTYALQAETGLISAAQLEAHSRPLLDQALGINPENGRALGLLASMNWFNALLTSGPASPASAKAKQALLDAVEIAPNDPNIYATLSAVEIASGNEEESLEWVDKGLERDPLSARLHLQRGRLLLGAMNDAEQAEEAFAKGREIEPEWTAVNFASGDAAFAQDRFADGIGWYQHAMELDPRDHELPAIIARFFYRLGLEQQGDNMLTRAQALAPDATWTRSIELERQLRAQNYERAVILAESIIRDDLDDRGGAFTLAVNGYVSSMIELGKPEAVVDFFESVKPGISEASYSPLSLKDVGMQFTLVHALIAAGSIDVAERILARLMAFADQAAPGWRDNDYVMVNLTLAQGAPELAADYALKDLDQPLGKILNWRLNYTLYAWFKPLAKDERFALRVKELEQETNAAGDEVRIMLAEQASASTES